MGVFCYQNHDRHVQFYFTKTSSISEHSKPSDNVWYSTFIVEYYLKLEVIVIVIGSVTASYGDFQLKLYTGVLTTGEHFMANQILVDVAKRKH